jgi:hypothetical protein
MPYEFDQADLLIFSDDPEALSAVPRPSPVHVTTPMNAIIYEVQVGPGRKRVLYYHQNFDTAPRTLGVRIVNLGASPVTPRVITYGEPPAFDIVGVGHRSVVGFLRALIAGGWTSLKLQPVGKAGDDALVAVSQARSGRLASAFVELDVPAGAQLKVQVLTAASAAALRSVGANGPLPGPGDGIGRSGVFDLSRGGTAHGDFAAVRWDVNAAPLEIPVPHPSPFPNAKVPQTIPGHDPSEAVYGLFTRRTVTLANSGATDAVAGIYAQACGGDSAGTCMVNGTIVELGTMTSGEEATRPGYEIGSVKIAARDKGTTSIDLLGTVDPSGKSPLKIVVAKKGALPASTSTTQVVSFRAVRRGERRHGTAGRKNRGRDGCRERDRPRGRGAVRGARRARRRRRPGAGGRARRARARRARTARRGARR